MTRRPTRQQLLNEITGLKLQLKAFAGAQPEPLPDLAPWETIHDRLRRLTHQVQALTAENHALRSAPFPNPPDLAERLIAPAPTFGQADRLMGELLHRSAQIAALTAEAARLRRANYKLKRFARTSYLDHQADRRAALTVLRQAAAERDRLQDELTAVREDYRRSEEKTMDRERHHKTELARLTAELAAARSKP